MKICVIGCGYVGLATAVAISINQSVTVYDIDSDLISKLRNKEIPTCDENLEKVFISNSSRIVIEEKKEQCIKENDCFILALPTDSKDGVLDTSILEKCIEEIDSNKSNSALIIIRSTVPVGFTKSMQDQFTHQKIYFWPEFLREGKAFYDIQNPSRIVLGGPESELEGIVNAIHKNRKMEFPIFYTTSQEAEAIKLFSNAYLAMRISFFNELDSFAAREDLDSKVIIQGVCSDLRIGDYYNNPSFGYGGYCLPKDTKQLSAQISNKKSVIYATCESNEWRKKEIISKIAGSSKKVGIYRLQMKKDSDDIRGSVMLEIVSELLKKGIQIYIYEPLVQDKVHMSELEFCNDIETLYDVCDIILANRVDEQLKPYIDKVYTRDLFYRD